MTNLKRVLLLLAVGFGLVSPAQGQLSTIGVSLVITNEGSPEYTFRGSETPGAIELPLFGNGAKINIFDSGEGTIHFEKPLIVTLNRAGVSGTLTRIVREVKFSLEAFEARSLIQLEKNPFSVVGNESFMDTFLPFVEGIDAGADPKTLTIPKLFRVLRLTLQGNLDLLTSQATQEAVQVTGTTELREVISPKGDMGDARIKSGIPVEVFDLTEHVSQKVLPHTARANGILPPLDLTVPAVEKGRVLRPARWNCDKTLNPPLGSGVASGQ